MKHRLPGKLFLGELLFPLISELIITNYLGLLKIICSTSPAVSRDISPQAGLPKLCPAWLWALLTTLHPQLLWTTWSNVSPGHTVEGFFLISPLNLPSCIITPCLATAGYVPLYWEIAPILWWLHSDTRGGTQIPQRMWGEKKKDTSLTKERTNCAFLTMRKILQHIGDTESYCQTGNTSCCLFFCVWLQSELPSYATLAKVRKHCSSGTCQQDGGSRLKSATINKESFFLILYED